MPASKVNVHLLRNAIRGHLTQHGDAKWDRFSRPAEIGYAAFRKHVRVVAGDMAAAGELPDKRSLQNRSSRRAVARVADASVVQLADLETADPLDIQAQLDLMLRHCEVLEEHALGDGTSAGIDAHALREAVRTRVGVLRLAVDATDRLYSITRIRLIHASMLRHISEADRGIACRIMGDLKAVDAQLGITLGDGL